ncbi:MAG: DUF542 domain-containing protein [Chitinophagaceae bacterium]|nr:DUF542 domain-containing protein [Chitinophagaceae bacterium]
MENLKEKTVGLIAAGDYRTCAVFEKYGIDYFNQGKILLGEIAVNGNITLDNLINELNQVKEGNIDQDVDFNNWSLDVLANYIIKTYHQPAEKEIPVIKQELDTLTQDQPNGSPDWTEIKTLFDKVAGEIVVHQKKEELILFPYIRKMADAKNNQKPFVRPPMTKSAENPVNMLTHEHQDQGETFKKIASLCREYKLPETVSKEHQEIIQHLKDFDEKLHLHIHLENNILFPKALQLDKELAG